MAKESLKVVYPDIAHQQIFAAIFILPGRDTRTPHVPENFIEVQTPD